MKQKSLIMIKGLDAVNALLSRCQPSPPQENLQDPYLVNLNFEANKMLPTENNSIVFPVAISEEAMKCLSQILSVDIESLFYKHTSEFKEKILDEKKEEIIKKERELLSEKTHFKSEIEKIGKKQKKLDIAVMHFLANAMKAYKPKSGSIDKIKMAQEMLYSYRDKDGNIHPEQFRELINKGILKEKVV